MKLKQWIIAGSVASLAFTPQAFSQDAEIEGNVDVDTPQVEAEAELETDAELQTRQEREGLIQVNQQDRVMPSNKASGLLGMEVRNPQGQKLGDIKDLVLDLNSGKISYAVLAVGGFLGLGEKLLAVPPEAFKAGQQDGHLILNADKSKIEAAPGFAATDWPEVHDPDLQSRTFWLGGEAVGSPGETEVERDRGGFEAEAEFDGDDKIYTDAEKDTEESVDVEVDTP